MRECIHVHCAFMHASVCVYVHPRMYMHVCMHDPQAGVGCFPQALSTLFWGDRISH